MPIIRDQWAAELDTIVRRRFREGVAGRAATLVGPSLFNMQTSSTGQENVTSAGAIGPDAWDNYERSGVVSQADFDKYYLKTYTHKEYPLEVVIERKLLDDSNIRQITDAPFRLGDSAMVKREYDMASVFNNSTSASFLGGDAVALLSAAHPYSAAKSGTTQSNLGTAALSADAIDAARTAMMQFTDDAGSPLGSNGTMLLVPPALTKTAHQAVGVLYGGQVGSVLDPNSGNNTVNPIAGMSVVTWTYLSDTNRWYLIDPVKMNMMLDWFDRIPLSIVPKVEDKTIRATWIAYMRYSFGFSSWQWVYGSEPS